MATENMDMDYSKMQNLCTRNVSDAAFDGTFSTDTEPLNASNFFKQTLLEILYQMMHRSIFY